MKFFQKSTTETFGLGLIQLQDGGFVGHSLTHTDVMQSFPELIDFGQHDLIWLCNIDQMRNRHPTGSAG